MKKWKASYTVEAAFMTPLLIGAMVIAMRYGLLFYEEVQQEKEHESVCSMWQVREFYRYQQLKEIGND